MCRFLKVYTVTTEAEYLLVTHSWLWCPCFHHWTGTIVNRDVPISTTLCSIVKPAPYLWERYDQDAAAFLSAGETQVTVGGVESPGRVAACMWRPHRAGGHLVEFFGTGEPKQSQDVLPYSLLLQDPGKKMRRRGWWSLLLQTTQKAL